MLRTQTWGGVNQVNLFADHLKYDTQFAKQEGTLYTFDITTINPPYDSFIFTYDRWQKARDLSQCVVHMVKLLILNLSQ